jgi:hypothetical protein
VIIIGARLEFFSSSHRGGGGFGGRVGVGGLPAAASKNAHQWMRAKKSVGRQENALKKGSPRLFKGGIF